MKRVILVVVVAACGGDDGPIEAPTDAPAGEARLEVSPGNFAVGASIRGTALTDLVVEVTNRGSARSGAISAAVTGSDYAIASTTCGELASRDTCTVKLTFTPSTSSDTVPITGALVVTADPGGEVTAMLSGIGLPTNVLVADETQLAFGAHAIGTTTARRTITVTNPGPDVSGALAVTFSTSSPPFAVHDDTCTGQTLAIDGTCTISVDYSPVGTVVLGSNGDETRLRVRGNPGGIAEILLQGSGYTLGKSPDQKMFADTTVGQVSAAQTFTFTNTTAAAMGPLDVSLSLGDTRQFSLSADTCDGATLAAHATCTVDVRFTPSAAGDKLSLLSVTAPMTGALRNETAAMVFGKAL